MYHGGDFALQARCVGFDSLALHILLLRSASPFGLRRFFGVRRLVAAFDLAFESLVARAIHSSWPWRNWDSTVQQGQHHRSKIVRPFRLRWSSWNDSGLPNRQGGFESRTELFPQQLPGRVTQLEACQSYKLEVESSNLS